MYILKIEDTQFELSLQYAFPAGCEARVYGAPPEYHAYESYVRDVLQEYGKIVSSRQLNDEKSLWEFSDGTTVSCVATWLAPVDDPYDLAVLDDI